MVQTASILVFISEKVSCTYLVAKLREADVFFCRIIFQLRVETIWLFFVQINKFLYFSLESMFLYTEKNNVS